ncbi:short-chain dehydrogenase/reductase [Croceicoccus estronivorus]|uniref:SDR family oxidoreductase n=1 Tax=Croceicoccus estronivorus TaxID=1172626 RepID=UPI000832B0DD|nr:SDR family oxidoreductase [Croceicoccus estronivorus]OCC24585.1 short-chain dehydrogenase/reductase [Croceicoccus estronivorus]
MPDFDRRTILAGGAAATALAAIPSTATARTGQPDLSGKSILVTGTSSGFGRLGAEHYARLGAKVFATMRDLPRPEAEDLRLLASKEGLDITVLEIDVLDDAQVADGVAEAERLTGGALDVLVNNAGIMITGPVEMQDMDAFHLLFETNVFGYQRMARAVLPAMRKARSGYIVNVASQAGRLIYPGLGAYSASKFAVESWAEQLAYELAPLGVGIGIIQPGGYPTKIMPNSNAASEALKQREPEERKADYPGLAAQMGSSATSAPQNDPMDIPNAIAELIAMAPGERPLRRAVANGPSPQEPINQVCAEVQLSMLGSGPFGPAARKVHGA